MPCRYALAFSIEAHFANCAQGSGDSGDVLKLLILIANNNDGSCFSYPSKPLKSIEESMY